MSTLIGQMVMALLLFAAGATAWTFATLERAVASAHERLATLSPGAATAYGEIELAMKYVRRLPRVGDTLLAEVREHRSMADYWGANYAAVVSPNDANGAPVERDPERLFVAANAAYRASRQESVDPLVAVQHLDLVVKSYALVLEKRPGHVDAAYNYEFVVRLRNLVAKTHRLLSATKSERVKGALPSGPTIHGHPGAPPFDPKLGKFELLIPLQSDEEDMPPEGKSKQKRGKG